MPVRRPRHSRPESAGLGARIATLVSAWIPSLLTRLPSLTRRACVAALVLAMATAGSLTGIITSNHRHGIAQAAAAPAGPTTTGQPSTDTTPTTSAGAVSRNASGPGSPTAPAGLPVVASSKPNSQGQAGVVPVPLAPRAVAGPIPMLAWQAYHYAAAGSGCNLPWYLLAGIGKIESNHGRYAGARFDITGTVHPAIYGPPTAYGRAMGPMQFIPPTWASYAADGNGDGISDPQNVFDATKAAARYLCRAGGADLSGAAAQRRAVFAYNHLDSYVADVLAFAAAYSNGASETTVPIVPITYPKAGATTSAGAARPTTSSSHPSGAPTKATTKATTTSAAPTTTGAPSPSCTTVPSPSTAQATTAGPTAATKSATTKSAATKSAATKAAAGKSTTPATTTSASPTTTSASPTTTSATKPSATTTSATKPSATTTSATTTSATPTSATTTPLKTTRSSATVRAPVATSSAAGACPPCPTVTPSSVRTTPSATVPPTCSPTTSATQTSAARAASATASATITHPIVPASPTATSAARAAGATAKVVATLTQNIVPLSPPKSAP